MKKSYMAAVAAAFACVAMGGYNVSAFDQNMQNYTLDAVVVEADATKNKFGDTITEQSYYRTGGDVKVITREEIEKRHYTDLTEAIKRIPGVTFQNPGYRGGEYGYQFYNNGVAINGDFRVIILVDGRRVDNTTSTRQDSSSVATKATGVNLNQVTNMENVEKIEVIKGPGASVYGPDAMGGVINIITRKGGVKPVGTIDLSTGSWDQHNYAMSYSGSAGDDGSFHYFVSANRNMSGDTKYNDAFSSQDGTLGGSRWKEDGVNIRLDKDFSDTRNLKVWYNYKAGKDGYPIAVPNMKYWNATDWDRIIFNATIGQLDANNQNMLIYNEDGTVSTNRRGQWKAHTLAGDSANPGYHNLYALDGKGYNSFSRFKNNDWDIVYTFNKENGMDSFIRVYDQNHRYSNRDYYKWYKDDNGKYDGVDAIKDYHNWVESQGGKVTTEQVQQWIKDHLAPFPGNQEALDKWVAETGGKATEPTDWVRERNRGLQLQYAKALGIHDIIASMTYDNSKTNSKRVNNDGTTTYSRVQQKSILAYVQDKMHLTDKWDFTPALRYSWYDGFTDTVDGVKSKTVGKSHNFSYAMNTEYMFNDSTSMYLGWTRIYRPIKESDYLPTDYVRLGQLENEKGNAWTLGIRKDLNDRTTVTVNYDWTYMSNAIASLPVWNNGQLMSAQVNAKEDKQSFNITVDTQLDDHWTVSASYDHMKDKWKAKDGYTLDPSWGYADPSDINTAINDLRPANHYSLNLSYENGKLYTGLLTNWYTGNSLNAFTAKRFLVLDWNVNYELTKDLTLYAVINNLTNEAYETSFNDWNGIGSSAMPGRSVLVGAKYTF